MPEASIKAHQRDRMAGAMVVALWSADALALLLVAWTRGFSQRPGVMIGLAFVMLFVTAALARSAFTISTWSPYSRRAMKVAARIGVSYVALVVGVLATGLDGGTPFGLFAFLFMLAGLTWSTMMYAVTAARVDARLRLADHGGQSAESTGERGERSSVRENQRESERVG